MNNLPEKPTRLQNSNQISDFHEPLQARATPGPKTERPTKRAAIVFILNRFRTGRANPDIHRRKGQITIFHRKQLLDF
jgi:hypothetical protein